jgi:flagellin-like protein
VPVGDRAVTPVLGVVLLVALTVALTAGIGGALLPETTLVDPPPTVSLDCTAHAGTDRVACVHRGGDRLDARELGLWLTVDGEPLTHQPPVPFFAARGFHAGPTGPFNSAADPGWTAGETAGVRLAATNRPGLDPGSRVTVRVVADGYTVLTVTVEARG